MSYKIGDEVTYIGATSAVCGLRYGVRYAIEKSTPRSVRIGGVWVESGLVSSAVAPAQAPAAKPASAAPLAMRKDAGKPQPIYTDLWPEAIKGIDRVSKFGETKYAKYNFTKGAPFSQHYNCLRRHMIALLNGEDKDPDAAAAGYEVWHVDSIAWNAMRMAHEFHARPELDDRPHVLAARERAAQAEAQRAIESGPFAESEQKK
jgi:hypothetical protein